MTFFDPFCAFLGHFFPILARVPGQDLACEIGGVKRGSGGVKKCETGSSEGLWNVP